jgi:hypothetical protein
MTVPSEALALYERLRCEVLCGQTCCEGLGAIVYHGLIRGLSLLSSQVAPAVAPVVTARAVPNVRTDPHFLHLLANMLLQTHQELTHVY